MIIKKITFSIVFLLILFSCGKKGDPVFKESKKEIKMNIFLINKV